MYPWAVIFRQIPREALILGLPFVLIIVVGLVTAAGLVGLLFTPRKYAVPLGLILGGSLGNWVDRVRLGYVVDFVTAPHWPTFNVADAALVGGMALHRVWEARSPSRALAKVAARQDGGATAMDSCG